MDHKVSNFQTQKAEWFKRPNFISTFQNYRAWIHFLAVKLSKWENMAEKWNWTSATRAKIHLHPFSAKWVFGLISFRSFEIWNFWIQPFENLALCFSAFRKWFSNERPNVKRPKVKNGPRKLKKIGWRELSEK